MPKQELEARADAELASVEESLIAEARAELEKERIAIPLLAIVQGTTRNPPEDARPGDFYNAVTGESFGSSIDLVVAGFNRGRFYVDKSTDQAYVAGSSDVVPGNWPPPFAGRVFSELPEAEETYKQRVNDGEIEWGKGPSISTTFNFTGFVIGSDIPVRLSLQRSAVPAARKMVTLLKAQRAPWDRLIHLTTSRVVDGDKTYFTPSASYGAAPDPELRAQVVELAVQLRSAEVQEVGHEATAEASPEKPAGVPSGLQDSI